MLRSYSDILDRCGTPLWYDGNGVPRYVPFHPDHTGVYDQIVALVEIACQDCDRRFQVAIEFDRLRLMTNRVELPAPNDPALVTRLANLLHFGDPPRHRDDVAGNACVAGDTMNSCPRRVIEFWEQRDFEWQRRPEFEREIRADWDRE
ncbi:MAG TPA: hypothetical protein VLT45_04475 [Kofleriaceae bacterium]|nr:hypothetical protein [Kofleriaceae bacterium]